jgi:hypothetical protein
MKTRITVHLPKDLLGRARRRAAAQGRTLAALIEDGLQLAVEAPRNPGQDERAAPSIETAAAPLTGIAVTDPSPRHAIATSPSSK